MQILDRLKFRKTVDGYNFCQCALAQPNPALSGGEKSTAEDVRTKRALLSSVSTPLQIEDSYRSLITKLYTHFQK